MNYYPNIQALSFVNLAEFSGRPEQIAKENGINETHGYTLVHDQGGSWAIFKGHVSPIKQKIEKLPTASENYGAAEDAAFSYQAFWSDICDLDEYTGIDCNA